MSQGICAVMAALSVLLVGTLGHAQFSGKKPVDMSDVELQAAGYQWESSTKHKGSLIGGGIALVPGALFHPTGHYFVGNAEAGWKLLKLQGLATGLLLAGSALRAWQDSGEEFDDFGGLMAQVGGAMFVTGYVANVVGVVKGTERSLPDFESRQGKSFVQGGYLWVGGEREICPEDTCHLTSVRLDLDLGSVRLSPNAMLDVQGGYEAFGVDGVWKVLQDPQKAYKFWGLGFEVSQVGEGGRITTTDSVQEVLVDESVLRLELSMVVQSGLDDMLILELPHLANLVVKTEIGVGLGIGGGARAAFPGDGDTRAYLLMEHAILVNLMRHLKSKTYYVFNEASPIAPMRPWLGYFGHELTWDLGGVELYADVAVGGAWTAGSGLRYRFLE